MTNLERRDNGERRRSFRVPLAAPVRVSATGQLPMDGMTLDCSVGGCAIQTTSPLDEDSSFVLSIDLDDGPLVTTGTARYCMRVGSRYRVGFEFTGLRSSEERRIAKLVAKQDRRTSVRLAVAAHVEYRRDLPGETFHSTSTTDISLGGIRFTLASRCDVGDRLEMVITLDQKQVPLGGTVVRVGSDDQGLYAAVCFDPPSTIPQEDLAAAIKRFLDDFPHISS